MLENIGWVIWGVFCFMLGMAAMHVIQCYNAQKYKKGLWHPTNRIQKRRLL